MTSFQSCRELEQSSSRLVERIVRRFISRAKPSNAMTVGILHGRDERFHALQYSIRAFSRTEIYSTVSEFELVKCYNYSVIIPNCIRQIFLPSFYIYTWKELLFVDKIMYLKLLEKIILSKFRFLIGIKEFYFLISLLYCNKSLYIV